MTKFRYSAFLHSSLELRPRTFGKERLYFCGAQANICVITNSNDALQRDFHSTLVADASVTARQESHDGAIFELASHVGPALDASADYSRLGRCA